MPTNQMWHLYQFGDLCIERMPRMSYNFETIILFCGDKIDIKVFIMFFRKAAWCWWCSSLSYSGFRPKYTLPIAGGITKILISPILLECWKGSHSADEPIRPRSVDRVCQKNVNKSQMGGTKVCWAAGNVDRGVRKRKRERERCWRERRIIRFLV